ncbi:LytR/AlgR family response regulator transcription factor [Bizionia sediminis]|uniref:LytR/AlgR family response regulator transcription factor n=1 Tax=Bizionia sediminis TaxID=1737064 RepID=A0ABW5KVX4_9FLAO
MKEYLQTKILIVEDDILIADYIAEILQDNQYCNVKMAHNVESAQYQMRLFKPDIVLMDINLEGTNAGIELAKQKNNEAAVIFVTGQLDVHLMGQACKTNPVAYLTKPIKPLDVLATVNLTIQKKQLQTFQFKDGYDLVSLPYSDIIFIKANGNYSNICSGSKKYTIRQSLNAIAKQLPIDTFKQTHRSYVINTTYIRRVSANSILVDTQLIPLSRTYAKQFRQ